MAAGLHVAPPPPPPHLIPSSRSPPLRLSLSRVSDAARGGCAASAHALKPDLGLRRPLSLSFPPLPPSPPVRTKATVGQESSLGFQCRGSPAASLPSSARSGQGKRWPTRCGGRAAHRSWYATSSPPSAGDCHAACHAPAVRRGAPRHLQAARRLQPLAPPPRGRPPRPPPPRPRRRPLQAPPRRNHSRRPRLRSRSCTPRSRPTRSWCPSATHYLLAARRSGSPECHRIRDVLRMWWRG